MKQETRYCRLAQIKSAERTLKFYSFSANDNNWPSVRASQLVPGSEDKSQTNFDARLILGSKVKSRTKF